jgi:hypothetical protein
MRSFGPVVPGGTTRDRGRPRLGRRPRRGRDRRRRRVVPQRDAPPERLLRPAHDRLGVPNVQSVVPADVDGDGDVDAVSTAPGANAVLWHDNTAGDATTWTARTIATGFASAWVAAAGDVDRDGDVDVAAIGAPVGAGTLAWFANTAGDGSAWTGSTVSTAFNRATQLELADVSGDGDLDLLGSGYYSATRLYENAAGTAPPGPRLPCPRRCRRPRHRRPRPRRRPRRRVHRVLLRRWPRLVPNLLGDGTAWSHGAIGTAFGVTYSLATADLDGTEISTSSTRAPTSSSARRSRYENVGGSGPPGFPRHPGRRGDDRGRRGPRPRRRRGRRLAGAARGALRPSRTTAVASSGRAARYRAPSTGPGSSPSPTSTAMATRTSLAAMAGASAVTGTRTAAARRRWRSSTRRPRARTTATSSRCCARP